MHVNVEQSACAGHGQCNATSPNVYKLDDDGFCLPVGVVAVEDERDARAGAAACPEQAITVAV